jgi:predicted porin
MVALQGESYVKRYLAYAGALGALAGIMNVAYAADSTDDSLTWFGVTLYGTVDVGYTYQNRGVPLSDYFPVGLETMVQKNATKKISSLSENGMSQSKVGLRGTYEFYPGFSGVFRLESAFDPLSGNLSDGVKSVVQNNGVAAINQGSNGDSSRAGQAFSGAAYAGVSSPKYGTLTIGRQNSLLMDNVGKYDPLGGSYAFSFVGYSGASGGTGDTQDGRFDSSAKYLVQVGPARAAVLYKSPDSGQPGHAIQADLGADPLPGWSVDAAYSNVKDEILATPASAAQITPCVPPATTGCLLPNIDVSNAANVTVSDNFAWEIASSYVWHQFKVSGAYENIHWRNPQVPLHAGMPDIGGYTLGWVNNTAYPHARMWQYFWLGVKYAYSPKLDLTAAWYYILQNNYNPANHCPGGVADAATCSGREAGYSLVADYKFNRHFDVYAGAMYSHLADGLAAGGPNIMSIDPTIGGRFNF